MGIKLSKYPKERLSYSQIDDEEKLERHRKENGIEQVCPNCGGKRFFITTMGMELCSACYYCMNIFI